MTAARRHHEGSLTLFVSGASDLSARAITHATSLCEDQLNGGYRLSIVDVHEDPDAVLSYGVLAAPTLVRTRPLPARRFIGDLSRVADVLSKLDLALPEPAPPRAADFPR